MEYQTKEKQIDLLEYWQTIMKRKWIVVAFTTVVLLIAGVSAFTKRPLYMARAKILIGSQESEMFNIREITSDYVYRGYDHMHQYLNTQLQVLTSRSLGERVAKKMNLVARPEFQALGKRRKNPLQGVKNIISFRWFFQLFASKRKPVDQGLAQIPKQDMNSSLAFAVLGGLIVSPIENTRVIELRYISPNPTLAADILNTIAEEFISYSIEMRYEVTQQASEFLNEQIAQLRKDLATNERELQRYGQEKELFFLSDRESTVLNKFADLNTAYTQSQIDRVNAEAAYRELKSLTVDALPESVSNPLIQSLKTQYTNIKNEYEEKKKFFKESYPDMIKLRARLDSMRDELRSEIKKAKDMAESEYRSAYKKEASLKNLLESQRRNVVRMNSNAILYNSLRIEVENKRNLLKSLIAKQNETLISARLGGLKSSNIKILDKALVPKAPFSPNTSRSLMLALLFGLFGGVGLIFFLEYLDSSIKGPEDVKKLTGLPSLGIIPKLSLNGLSQKGGYGDYYNYASHPSGMKHSEIMSKIKGIELVNSEYPQFFISEDYRTVRTSILLSHAGRPPKIIAFSSSLPQEGKTATVANMAVAFAQLKKQTLLIDADLRKPRLHRIFKIRNNVGLSSFLTGGIMFEETIRKSIVDNIWMIPSGPLPPNPAELLNSSKMVEMLDEARDNFDVVLLDTPPVLAVIDPVIVSSLAESTVFVVKAGKTGRKPFLKAIEELSRAKSKIIGVLFNEMKMRREGYRSTYYRHFYRKQYFGSGQDEAK